MKNIPFDYPFDRKDELTNKQAETFTSMGGITKQLCQKNDILWRVVPTFKGKVFSEYWMDVPTMRTIMAILVSRNDFSNEAKVELFMNSLGILYQWGEENRAEKAKGNALMQQKLTNWKSELWKVKVTLKKEVPCYVGITAPQKGLRMDNRAEFKTGGFTQIVIPRFYGLNNMDAKEWADYEKPVLI
jgi:hypothetical protein